MSLALPADARGFQGERAGIVSRAVAGVLDLVVVAVLVVGAVVARSVWAFFFSDAAPLRLNWPSRFGLLSLGGAVLLVYLAWGWARTGRTVGKRVVGLALVDTSGRPVSALVAIARAALYVVFPIGLLWCSVSGTRRSVQDLLLRTAVVYDWRGRGRRR